MITCRYCGTNFESTFGNVCPICKGKNDPDDQVMEVEYDENDFQENTDRSKEFITVNKNQLIVVMAVICAIISCIFASGLYYIRSLKKKEAEYKTAMENAYNSGIRAFDDKRYDQAIDELSKVAPDSDHYTDATSAIDEAKEGYIKDVLKGAAEYVDNENYNQAIALLDSAIAKIGDNDLLEMSAKRDEYYSLKVDSITTKAIEEAEFAYNNNQIETAIRTLLKARDDIGEDSVILDVIVTQYIDEYKKSVVEEVDNLMATEGYKVYETGIAMIDNSLAVIGYDDELSDKKDELYTYKPVPLTDLYVIENYYTNDIKRGECVDRLGNHYSGQAFCFDAWFGSKMIFRTAGNYKRLTATIAPSTYEDEYGFNVSSRSPKFYVIDGDDDVIASFPVSSLTEPFEIDVDISGANNLKLAITDFNNPEADTCKVLCIDAYLYSK